MPSVERMGLLDGLAGLIKLPFGLAMLVLLVVVVLAACWIVKEYPGIAVLTLEVMLVAARIVLAVTPLPVAVEGSMLMVAGLVVLTGWLLEDRLREIPSPSAWVSRALLRLSRSLVMVVGSTSLVVIPLLLPLVWLEAVLEVSMPLASRTELR